MLTDPFSVRRGYVEPRYYLHYRVGKKEDGSPRYEMRAAKGARTMEDARKQLAVIEAPVAQGLSPVPEERPLSSNLCPLLEHWRNGLDNRNADDDRSRIDRHLLPRFGELTIERLTLAQIMNWLDDLREPPYLRREMEPKSTTRGSCERLGPVPGRRERRAPRAVGTLVIAACAIAACASQAGVPYHMRSWNRSFPPHRVIGNIYYVGSNGIAQFLIATEQGLILVDSGFEASVPRLAANVRALGFRFEDVKILLASHAHIDHVQAHALVRRMTGATVVASAPDAAVIATGGKGEAVYDGVFTWTPCPVDRIIADGDRVTLGGTTLVAHLTPGHTRGATTWTMNVTESGRSLAVVFFPSANVNPGVRLVGNPRYPEIAGDFRRSFAIWKALPCDVPLGSHGSFYDMEAKHQRLASGGAANPFVDPEGYRKLITEAEQRFEDQLADESR